MRSRPNPPAARITEIFSSLQGEGPLAGQRHLFVRFESCHMACAYCDESRKKGRRMSLEEVLNEVQRFERREGPHACVSLTGGEPLLYADFIIPFCAKLRRQGFPVLLETSGVLWRQLSKVLKCCDMIAMDLKLASVTRQCDFFDAHKKFLQLAAKRTVYLKAVISRGVDVRDFERHVRMAARIAPRATLFLQPCESGRGKYPDLPLMSFLNRLQRIGTQYLPDVRVGIQLHKLMNIQ